MITGIGHDVVEMDRVRKLLSDVKLSERFMRRVLTEREYMLAASAPERRVELVAGRFAVKESVSKALGCGIGSKLGFLDMEILPDESGKPRCTLSEQSLIRVGLAGESYAIHVSISHERSLASAFAVVERFK